MIFEDNNAESAMGTIWSSSPCSTSVGTSNFFRSSVKSVSENAYDCVKAFSETGLHAPGPELIEQTLGDPSAGPVGAVELDGQVLVVLRAIPREARPDAVEDLDRQALRI